MAKEHCDGIEFDGKISVEFGPPGVPGYPDPYYAESRMTDSIQQGTPRHRLQQIRLTAPTIIFTARVTARGDARHWKAGFLQAVTEAHWGANYSDGKVHRCRLNTTYGHLKDGYDESSIFMKPEWSFTQSEDEPGLQATSVNASDSPAQLFYKQYSGDPFHPLTPQAGAELGKLARTDGKMIFRTFLAVAHAGRKSVVILGEHRWTLTWDGSYDSEDGTWTSDNIDGFIVQDDYDLGEVHADLTAASETPFSLFLETAEKSCEVETAPGVWTPCKNCLPTLDPAHRPTRAKWVT